MTRKSVSTLALAGVTLLALGTTAACSSEETPGPVPTTSVTTVTETSTRTHTPLTPPTPRTSVEFRPDGVSTDYTPSEVEFMKAACDLYDEGNSAVDVLIESFVMPETTPLEHDPERVGELIIMSIPEFCPRHTDEIDKFANGWA